MEFVGTAQTLLTRLILLQILLAIIFIAPSAAFADGKLSRARNAVRKHDAKPKPKPKKRDRSHDRDDEQDDHDRPSGNRRKKSKGWGNGFTPGFALSISSNHRKRRPRRHVYPVAPVCDAYSEIICDPPYPVVPAPQIYDAVVPANPAPVLNGPTIESTHIAPPVLVPGEFVEICDNSDWFEDKSSRFWATFGSDFDGITSGGLGLNLQAAGSLGIDSSVTTLRESGPSFRDHFWIGDVNLVYEVLNRGDVRGRMGLGVNWLSDSWGAEAGFNLTAGFDIRLTDKWLLSAEGDLGNLGDADFLHARINLARRFETCEIMLGADHFDFGGAVVNNLFTGILFRF